MRRWHWGLLLLLLTTLLLAQAPARLLGWFVPAETLLLDGVQGTVWQGSAARSVLTIPGGHLHLGALQWRLSPWSMLTLSPRVAVRSQWGRQRIEARVTYGGAGDLRLKDVDATVSATLVRQFVPLELRGDLNLLASELVLRDGRPHAADGRLVWLSGGWQSPDGPRPLGDYALDFSQPPGEPLVGEVQTLAGSLQAAGRVTLDDGSYDVDMRLTGTGLNDPQLRQALQLLAAPEGDGFRVSLQGGID